MAHLLNNDSEKKKTFQREHRDNILVVEGNNKTGYIYVTITPTKQLNHFQNKDKTKVNIIL